MSGSLKKSFQEMLSLADIKINGKRGQDIVVHNPEIYHRVLTRGSLGLGESYMNGDWDCRNLDKFFCNILSAELHSKIGSKLIWPAIKSRLVNLQSQKRAYEVGKKHYDAGNELYSYMLDKRLVYTCGYWRKAKTLDKAQEDKLDLVCRKLGLKKGQKVLDIGCGWGSFAKFAAEKYKAKVVGITISKEQVNLAKEMCKGLNVEIRLQDYRDLVKSGEKFDHVVSLGMFEHVGVKNYREYMNVVSKVLKEDGLFLLHTIGRNTSANFGDPWMTKYIFPNSMLPSVKQIAESSEGLFVIEDWHNFGADYDKTLMAWHRNFVKSWSKIKEDYDDRFYRMWNYYLLSSAGAFRARSIQLWQIVLSKKGVKGGYESVR